MCIVGCTIFTVVHLVFILNLYTCRTMMAICHHQSYRTYLVHVLWCLGVQMSIILCAPITTVGYHCMDIWPSGSKWSWLFISFTERLVKFEMKWLFDVDIRMITLFCNLMIDFIQTYHPVGCPQNHWVPGVLRISISKW